MIYFRWLQPTAGTRKKQGFSHMFLKVLIFPCNVAKAIFLHFQFDRQLKQTAIIINRRYLPLNKLFMCGKKNIRAIYPGKEYGNTDVSPLWGWVFTFF